MEMAGTSKVKLGIIVTSAILITRCFVPSALKTKVAPSHVQHLVTPKLCQAARNVKSQSQSSLGTISSKDMKIPMKKVFNVYTEVASTVCGISIIEIRI